MLCLLLVSIRTTSYCGFLVGRQPIRILRLVMKRIALFLMLISILILTFGKDFAVNFYDGARAHGNYFLSYASFYLADQTTDSNKKKNRNNYNINKAEEFLRRCWYNGYFTASAIVSADYIAVSSLSHDFSGLGHIIFGIVYFLFFLKIRYPADVIYKISNGRI
jgi:hypothetical protein